MIICTIKKAFHLNLKASHGHKQNQHENPSNGRPKQK